MPRKSSAKSKEIKILGIETSCDETSVALLQFTINNEQLTIKKHLIATQIPIHARYGGVVPEIAARTHVAEVVSLLEKTVGWSKLTTPLIKGGRGDFDAVAVTQGPGLATALRVGFEAGKTLAWAYGKPLVPVNHLEGHMASAWLVPANRRNWKFPILFLLVSGGHTELVLMKDFGDYKVLGRTRDDAAGECFDKTAKLLGLPYPGGPHLSKLAVNGNPKAFDLPRPMINDPSLDFSFSGLKTAVRQLLERTTYNVQRTTSENKRGTKYVVRGKVIDDLCASIQAAIVDVLVSKTIKAALKVNPTAVAVVGGVSANPMLKSELKKALRKACPKVKFLAPAKGLYTDNGAMIAAAGLWNLMQNKKLPAWRNLDAEPDLDL
ncbi:MAG: tRNA (adenosine(37)-N6)-threonylcarbamoyltransferase complex transferase subunit TsaD [Patescibacteria group bacterium]|nr:tRNA (adenosine(37)-N6)-threonylcarbamoyltransferase complex transferase subunit TsaD [Patescibacteria group bacterium]